MKLGLLDRTRAAVGRPLLRLLLDSPWWQRRLRPERPAPGLDPDLAMMLALDDRTGDTQLWRCSPAAARRKVATSVAIVQGPIARDPRFSIQEVSIPGPSGALPARIYATAGSPRLLPGLVYIHGGGWVTGDLDTHDSLCRLLAQHGTMRVISISYRMAPEHPFPAAVTDSLAAFRHIAAQAEELGLIPDQLGVAGDSAGGNLAAVIGLRTRGDIRRPALAVLLYPALDATCAWPSHTQLAEGYFLTREAISWYYGHYLGADPATRRDPDCSPLLAPELAGAPPTLIAAAAFDPLRDEAAAYAERLRAAGVPTSYRCLPGLIHGFALMTGASPAARAATEELARTTGKALREGLPDSARPSPS